MRPAQGFGSGYARGNESFPGLPDYAKNDLYNCSLYGKKEFGPAYLSGVVGYTHGWNNVTRTIQFDTLARRQAVGSMNGDLLGTVFETGYNMDAGRWRLTPVAGLRYVRGAMAATTETGADSLDLAVGGYNRHSLASHFGAKLAFCMAKKWRAEGYGQWQREFGDVDSVVPMAFVGSPSGYTVQGVALGRDAARTGLVVIGDVTNRISVNLNYDALLRSSYASQQLTGGLSFGF